MPGIEPSTGASLIGPIDGLQMTIVDDQLVVLDPRTHRRVLLNASAALIFTAIETRRTLDDLVAQLVDEVGMDAEDLFHDVCGTVDRLLVQGMLERDEPAVAEPSTEPVATTDPVEEPAGTRPDPTVGVTWSFDSGPRLIAGTTVVLRAETAEFTTELEAACAGFADAAAPRPAEHRIEVIVAAAADGVEHEPPDDGAAGRFRVVVDGMTRTGSLEAAEVTASMLDQLDLVLIDHAAGLRFHAGAAERDGRVVVVMGESGQGKSTLTAGLVRAGWSYVTDELVAIEPTTLAAHGYARPFDLDDTSREMLERPEADLVTGSHKDKVLARHFGPASAGGTVVLNVLLTGEPPAAHATSLVEEVPAAEAIMSILTLTFATTFEDPGALAHLGAMCTKVPTIRLDRAPLPDMIRVIEQHVAAGDPATVGTGR